MKIFLTVTIVCSLSWSLTVPAVAPVAAVNPIDYAALFGGIFAVTNSVGDYNRSIVTPSYTCGPDWQPPEKVQVDGADNGTKEKDTKPEAADIEVDGKLKDPVADAKFRMDENSNSSKILSQGCIQDKLDILEKCFPPMADKLKKREVTFDQLSKMPHEGFHIKSYSKETSEARMWEFHHENRAKQDTGLTVMDGYHFGKGKVYGAEMMFFPRKQVPQYVTKGNLLEVTLANGEVVNFDTSSGAVKSGVLTENKPIKGKKPDIKYQGSGVMIQMIGIDGAGKSYKETATDAYIYKKGFKPCKVPSADFWPQSKRDKANNFKFATDEGLDEWLKKSKCGFSL